MIFKKKLFFYLTVLFTLVCSLAAIFWPKDYTSKASYEPLNTGADLEISSNLSALGSLVGINTDFNNQIDAVSLAFELLNSEDFIEKVFYENDYKQRLFAVKYYNFSENQEYFDLSIFDNTKNLWTRQVSYPRLAEPSNQEIIRKLNKHLKYIQDKDTLLIKFELNHRSPLFAKEFLEHLISSLNSELKFREKTSTTKAIGFLETELQKPQINETRQIFSNMLESYLNKILLLEVREDYLLQAVHYPSFSIIPNQPRLLIRLIIALFIAIGLSTYFSSFTFLNQMKQIAKIVKFKD